MLQEKIIPDLGSDERSREAGQSFEGRQQIPEAQRTSRETARPLEPSRKEADQAGQLSDAETQDSNAQNTQTETATATLAATAAPTERAVDTHFAETSIDDASTASEVLENIEDINEMLNDRAA